MVKVRSAKAAVLGMAVMLAIFAGPGVVETLRSGSVGLPPPSQGVNGCDVPILHAASFGPIYSINVTKGIALAWSSPQFLSYTGDVPCSAGILEALGSGTPPTVSGCDTGTAPASYCNFTVKLIFTYPTNYPTKASSLGDGYVLVVVENPSESSVLSVSVADGALYFPSIIPEGGPTTA